MSFPLPVPPFVPFNEHYLLRVILEWSNSEGHVFHQLMGPWGQPRFRVVFWLAVGFLRPALRFCGVPELSWPLGYPLEIPESPTAPFTPSPSWSILHLLFLSCTLFTLVGTLQFCGGLGHSSSVKEHWHTTLNIWISIFWNTKYLVYFVYFQNQTI